MTNNKIVLFQASIVLSDWSPESRVINLNA